MLLQPDKSDFILATIKQVEAHKARNNCTLMKTIEVNNNHKNKYWKPKITLSIWSSNCSRFPYGKLTKTNSDSVHMKE